MRSHWGISLVAAYALKCLGERITVDLFESPSEFAHRLELGMPRVACFANYIWNVELSYQFAKRIKAAAPRYRHHLRWTKLPRGRARTAGFPWVLSGD